MDKFLYPDKNTKLSFLIVPGIAWYLLCLAIWHIFLPCIKELKAVYVIPFLILLAVFAGFDANLGDYLSLSRAIVYAPFFYLGFYMPKEKMAFFYNTKIFTRIISLLLVSLYFCLLYKYDEVLYLLRPVFTGRNSYSVIDLPYASWLRLLCYAIATLLSLLIMLIISNKETGLSIIGQRTLQVYFVHKFFIMVWYYAKIAEAISGLSPRAKLLFIPISIIVAYILSLKIFSYPFDFIALLSKKIYETTTNKSTK